MPASEYKSSFMLPMDMIDQFLEYLSQSCTILDNTSKYQVGRFEHNSHKILLYQSGIVIFEDDTLVHDLISQFLTEHNIDHDQFEKYAVTNETEEESTGWEETPKGVWLTEKQIEALLTTLGDELEIQPGEKHERGRFVKEDQILVINNNGVVYTIGGFEGILSLLRSIIRNNDPYEMYDRIVLLDEIGRWERIGPVCIVLVDVMKSNQIELQLAGVKDDTLSRNTDYQEFVPVIEEHATYYSHLITPEQINQNIDSKPNYQKYLKNEYKQFIAGKLLELNENTLLIIDDQLNDLLDHNELITVSKEGRNTPAIGISSTIANALVDKWKEDWYQKTGIHIERHNLDQIRDHKLRQQFGKEFLL